MFNDVGEEIHVHTRFKWEQNYQLCGWLMLEQYCHSPGGFYNQLVGILGPQGDESPLNRSADAFMYQAMDCAFAHGGCDQIQETYDDWSETRGAHSWPLE